MSSAFDKREGAINKTATWRGFEVPTFMLSALHAADAIRAAGYPMVAPEDRAGIEAEWSAGLAKLAARKADEVDLVEWSNVPTAENLWGQYINAIASLAHINYKFVEPVLREQYDIWLSGKQPADPSPSLVALGTLKAQKFDISESMTPQQIADSVHKYEWAAAFTPLRIGLIVGGAVALGVVIWLLARHRKQAQLALKSA